MRRTVPLLAASALVLCACGDDETDRFSCEDALGSFEPCGGDVVGTWEIDDTCLEDDGLEGLLDLPRPQCDDARIDASGTRVTGSTTFSEDGTFATATKSDLRMAMTLDDDCLQAVSGSSASGSAICELMASTPSSQFQLSCEYSAGRCRCTMTGPSDSSDSSGRYETRDGKLLTGVEPPLEAAAYCVSGDRLLVHQGGNDQPAALTIYRRR